MSSIEEALAKTTTPDPETGLYPNHDNYRIYMNGDNSQTRVLFNVQIYTTVGQAFEFQRAGEGILFIVAAQRVDMIEKISKLEMQYERSQGNVPS